MLAFSAGVAAGLAPLIHSELLRWPGSFQSAPSLRIIAGNAVMGGAALALLAILAGTATRRLGSSWYQGVDGAAWLAAPLALLLFLNVGLFWPRPGVVRATLVVVTLGLGAALTSLWRRRGGDAVVGMRDSRRMALAAIVLAGDVGTGVALLRHVAVDTLPASAAPLVRFDELRPASHGRIDRLDIVSRVMPRDQAVAIDTQPSTGAFVEIRAKLGRGSEPASLVQVPGER